MLYNPRKVEEQFQLITSTLNNRVSQEDIVYVDQGLIDHFEKKYDTSFCPYYFQVVETKEKLTLICDKFLIWLLPKKENLELMTVILIALNSNPAKLELILTTPGNYSGSRTILEIVSATLQEIEENENTLRSLQ